MLLRYKQYVHIFILFFIGSKHYFIVSSNSKNFYKKDEDLMVRSIFQTNTQKLTLQSKLFIKTLTP